MADEARHWLEIANRDLKAVRNNVLGPDPTTEVAAYHCQQAAEKIVKAALIAEGIDPPRWHNIDDLVDLLPSGHRLVDSLRPLGQFTPYGIAFRYPALDPDVLPNPPAKEEVLQWLGVLETVIATVGRVISPGR